MNTCTLCFQEIDKTKFMLVGGKGANLGELSRMKEVQVPEGFCVTTEVYKEITENCEAFNSLLDQLSFLKADNLKQISETSLRVREVIEEIAIPKNIENEIVHHLQLLGEKMPLQCGPAQRQKIYLQPLLRDSRIHI